jgi:lysophospholipase L1-like esterase
MTPFQVMRLRAIVAASFTFPTIADDNITDGNEGTTTTGWSATVGSPTFSQSGSTVRMTGAAGGNTGELALTGPASSDFILYLNMAARYQAASYAYLTLTGSGGEALDIIFGYNYETGSAQQGTISSYDWVSAGVNNIATGVDYSVAQEIAIHVDRNRSCVNLFYKEPGTGKWDFRGSYAYNAAYALLATAKLLCGGAGNYIEYDWMLYTRPNLVAIGDSIVAGHNFFDPNPSVYGGEDDYDNTWMKHCLIYPSLRNNIIVNKGIGSQTSTQLEARKNEATDCDPRVVFLQVSSNDQANAISQATRTTKIQSMVDDVVAAGAEAIILNGMYATSTAPDNTPADLRDYQLDWWDNYLPTITDHYMSIDVMQPMLDAGFQDAALTEADGIHPNLAGYTAIGEYIANYATY